jgi:hypothetical protein
MCWNPSDVLQEHVNSIFRMNEEAKKDTILKQAVRSLPHASCSFLAWFIFDSAIGDMFIQNLC